MLEKKILSTKSTPEISLNPDGIIKIRGRSMIANVTEFSKQIEDWVEEYICDPADITCVDFHLEYLSTKYIINWYYEEGDEDILEKGECISSVLDIPFNFIKICDTLMPECDPLKW